MKLARKISLSFLTVALVLSAFAGATVYFIAKDNLEKSIVRNLDSLLASRVAHIKTYLEMLKISVGQLSESFTLENFLKSENKQTPQGREFFELARRRLVKTQAANPSIAEFFLMDRNGLVVVSSSEKSIGQDMSSDSLFVGGQKEIYIKDAYFPEVYKEPLLGISAPFRNHETGEFLGVLAARVKIGDLEKITGTKAGLSEKGEMFIINKYGYMITSSRFNRGTPLKQKMGAETLCVYCHGTGESTKEKGFALLGGKDGFLGHKMAYVFLNYRGVPVLGAYQYIPEMQWGVLAEVDAKEVFASLTQMTSIFLMIFLAVPFIAWGLGTAVARLVTTPLDLLQAGMAIVGQGDLNYKVGTNAKDEIGQLSRSFDAMTENLRNKTTSVEKLNREIMERTRLDQANREQASFLRNLMSSIPSPVFYKNLEGVYLGCNKAFEAFFGIPAERLVGKRDEDLFPPELARLYQEKDAELFTIPGIQVYEASVKDGGGDPRSIVFHKATFTGVSGEVQGIIGVAMDITLRKRAEELLKESEKRFLDVLYASHDAILLIDGETFVNCNEATVRMLGYPNRKEFLMKHPSELSPPFQPDGRNSFEKANEMMKIAFTEGFHRFEWVHRKANGEDFPVEVSLTPVVIYGKNILHCLWRDITGLKEVERAIRDSEVRYRTLVENLPGVVFRCRNDQDWTMEYMSEETMNLTGYPVSDFIGNQVRTYASLIHPDDRRKVVDAIQIGLMKKESYVVEYRITTASGRTKWVYEKGQGVLNSEGFLIYIDGAIFDMTEERTAELQVRQLSQAVEQSPSSVVITDKDGRIEYVNQKFTEITGYSSGEALGQNPRILKSGEHPPEFYKALWDTVLSGKEWQGQLCNKKKNGEFYWESARIAPMRNEKGEITHFVALKEDITYRRQIEEQLRHSLRMEAVGRLAGGIAHDFNNMLTVINGYSGYLLGKMNPEDPYYDKVREIRDAGDCAATIVRQLLNLSRKEAPKPQLIKVAEAALKMERMINRLLGSDIEFKVDHVAEGGLVKMDPGQMEQVILNLLVNAREAMPGGGVLTFATDVVRIEEIHEELRPSRDRTGDFVRITVKDTGIGIDPALRKRIFEPFFTTKKRGMNTGLGLSIVYGIVEQAGGAISLESQLGKGTTFRVYLPRAQDDSNLVSGSGREVLPQGRGKILLVEDESQVREFAMQVLRERGYDVRVARGGEEALAMLAEDPGKRFDLLLTDLTMPKMNGKELVLRIREMIPGLKVIFMSGYSEQTVADVKGADFLQKPFNHGELSVKVWSVLGR